MLCTALDCYASKTQRHVKRRRLLPALASQGGDRGGLTAKLKANPFKTPLPSIRLTNALSDIEFLTSKCRPFYLPREFTTRSRADLNGAIRAGINAYSQKIQGLFQDPTNTGIANRYRIQDCSTTMCGQH